MVHSNFHPLLRLCFVHSMVYMLFGDKKLVLPNLTGKNIGCWLNALVWFGMHWVGESPPGYIGLYAILLL